MEPEKIKPKASRIAPDLPIGNEGTKGSSIAPRATGPGGGASRLTRVRRIERNSSWVKVGAPDKAAFGTFQRVDPKYALIKELEWKLAQPSHFRYVAFAGALGVIFLLFIGFKLKTILLASPKPSKIELKANHQRERVLGESGGLTPPVAADPGTSREPKPPRQANPSEAEGMSP
jgi:hypothetical protein